MRTLLIDADSMCYEAAFRHTDAYDWGDGKASVFMDSETAKKELRERIEGLVEELAADAVVVALTDYDKPCFRKSIFKDYKKNRHEKPEMLHKLRAHLLTKFRCYIRPGLEADDVVGILATHPKVIKGEKIIVSIDKDLRSIPGKLYNPDKPALKVQTITAHEADLFFYTQVLTGDPVDTYPGCPGIGPKKAEKILYDIAPGDMWSAVVDAYENSGLDEEAALVQARVARILRAEDYDFTKKRPKLWKPPKQK